MPSCTSVKCGGGAHGASRPRRAGAKEARSRRCGRQSRAAAPSCRPPRRRRGRRAASRRARTNGGRAQTTGAAAMETSASATAVSTRTYFSTVRSCTRHTDTSHAGPPCAADGYHGARVGHAQRRARVVRPRHAGAHVRVHRRRVAHHLREDADARLAHDLALLVHGDALACLHEQAARPARACTRTRARVLSPPRRLPGRWRATCSARSTASTPCASKLADAQHDHRVGAPPCPPPPARRRCSAWSPCRGGGARPPLRERGRERHCSSRSRVSKTRCMRVEVARALLHARRGRPGGGGGVAAPVAHRTAREKTDAARSICCAPPRGPADLSRASSSPSRLLPPLSAVPSLLGRARPNAHSSTCAAPLGPDRRRCPARWCGCGRASSCSASASTSGPPRARVGLLQLPRWPHALSHSALRQQGLATRASPKAPSAPPASRGASPSPTPHRRRRT